MKIRDIALGMALVVPGIAIAQAPGPERDDAMLTGRRLSVINEAMMCASARDTRLMNDLFDVEAQITQEFESRVTSPYWRGVVEGYRAASQSMLFVAHVGNRQRDCDANTGTLNRLLLDLRR